MKKDFKIKKRFTLSMPKGFTLIEILVVITIISILATVGTTSYTTLTKNSRDSRRKADLEEVRAALEMYKSNIGLYPNGIVTGNPIADPTNTYLQKVPTDPSSYSYNFAVTTTSYLLGAYLENEANGTGLCGNCGGNPVKSCNYCLTPYGRK